MGLSLNHVTLIPMTICVAQQDAILDPRLHYCLGKVSKKELVPKFSSNSQISTLPFLLILLQSFYQLDCAFRGSKNYFLPRFSKTLGKK